MAEWVFLNYGQRPEARDQRRKIRAHVTRRQHAKNRRDRQSHLEAEKCDETTAQPQCDANCKHSCPPEECNETTARPRCNIDCKPSCPPAHALSLRNSDLAEKPVDTERVSHVSTLLLGSPHSIDLNTAPVPQKRWYSWLHDYWFDCTLPRAKSRLKMSESQLQKYIAWTRNLQCTDSAMYYMSLLLATGIPVANGQFPLVKALWLRGRAVTAIKEALADPERATNDAMIQAVGYIALHEHIYGDRTSAHLVHRPAQQRMIAMRGGVDRLDLPMEVKQIMVWYDQLMAAEAGTQLYFSTLVDGRCIKSYSAADAIDVTNNASPLRHKHPGYRG